MAKKTDDFATIRQEIIDGNFAPIYLLHGEESYFIDQITSLLLEKVVAEEDRDFDLTQFYGSETSLVEVISACRRFPMSSPYQLVTLQEVQSMDQRVNNIDDLCIYLQHPMPSTVLLVTCKTKTIDGRKKFVQECKKIGRVLESVRYRDYELPQVLPGFIRDLGLQADQEAIQAICEYIGTDMSRIFSELEKLRLTIKGNKITRSDVTEHVGISKEYNSFELVSAIAVKDAKKVELCRRYFVHNPKACPLVMTISQLFGFFRNLMLAFYCVDKSERGLMSELKVPFPAAKDLVKAMKVYNAWKTMANISLLREADAKFKGARGGTYTEGEIMQELFYKLMH